MPSTARSTPAEEMVGNEESFEEIRTTVPESQESKFEDFMQRMGYDVSSLLEKACPVKNPNKRGGPKCTSTPNQTIDSEDDWSVSSISDCEEIFKQGMYLENCSFDEERPHRDFTTCTWETLESTRTKSSKPTSTSSGLEYSNVDLQHSRKKSLHSYSAVDPTPTETIEEEQTCNKNMANDASISVPKTSINQQEPEVTNFPNMMTLNLQPCIHLERLKSNEFEKYMHPKKKLSARRQSKSNDVQLGLNTVANCDVQAKESSQNSTHTSKNDITENQVPPREKDFPLVKESTGISMAKKSTEDTFQQKLIQSLGNIDSSVSARNNSPVRTTGTMQLPHRRIMTSSDFLTPLQKKIPQEKNTDSNVSTPTINCRPVKKRKVSNAKENITHGEITEQSKKKNCGQLTTLSSNEVEKKNLVGPKNKKQLMFPKELKMVENKIKTRPNNDPVESSKREIIAKIFSPKGTQSPSSSAVKPKKAATNDRGLEDASQSAVETEMSVTGTADVPVTIENDASLNIPRNIKSKKNIISVQSQVVTTDILAKSSRTKRRYRIVYLGPSIIRSFKNAKPDILEKKCLEQDLIKN